MSTGYRALPDVPGGGVGAAAKRSRCPSSHESVSRIRLPVEPPDEKEETEEQSQPSREG